MLLKQENKFLKKGKKFKQSAFFFSVNRRIVQKGKQQYKA